MENVNCIQGDKKSNALGNGLHEQDILYLQQVNIRDGSKVTYALLAVTEQHMKQEINHINLVIGYFLFLSNF